MAKVKTKAAEETSLSELAQSQSESESEPKSGSDTLTDAPPDDAEPLAKIGPDDAEPASPEPTLAAAIRDPTTMEVYELSDDERASEIARLVPYREAIATANTAWKAKVKEAQDREDKLQQEIADARRELVKAENAYQPTHIAGRLIQLEALVKRGG